MRRPGVALQTQFDIQAESDYTLLHFSQQFVKVVPSLLYDNDYNFIQSVFFLIGQIGTNGIVAFREEFPHYRAVLFPTNFSGPAYVVAPYWADADARLGGQIRYEIFYRECNATSNRLLDRVGTFITNETGVKFTGWVEMITIQILVKNIPYTLHCRKHNPITCSCNSKKLLKNFRTLSLSLGYQLSSISGHC